MVVALAAGATIGAVNAFLVVKVRINSLIATLGMSTILLGLTSGVSNNQQIAGLSKARHRGLAKIDWQFTFAMAAYNLVRLPKLLKAPA